MNGAVAAMALDTKKGGPQMPRKPPPPPAPKITPDVVASVTTAFRTGADFALAASLASVSRQALYQYQDKHPGVKQAWEEARAEADGRVVRKLFLKANKGDLGAMIFWLKNRHPAEWRDAPRTTVNVNIGKEDLEKMSDADLASLVAKLG